MEALASRWLPSQDLMMEEDLGYLQHEQYYWESNSQDFDQIILQPYEKQIQPTAAAAAHPSSTSFAPPLICRTTSDASSLSISEAEIKPTTLQINKNNNAQQKTTKMTSILSFGSASEDPLATSYEHVHDKLLLIPAGSKRSSLLYHHDATASPISVRSKKAVVDAPLTRPNQTVRTQLAHQDHIMAERKRREKLSERFIQLSSVLPNLKKMDKASVLSDAIKYVKQLQEKVKVLEEENKKKAELNDQPALVVKISGTAAAAPEIEARQSGETFLIKIHCANHGGIIVSALVEIGKLQLSVTNASATAFPGSHIDLTIVAQIEEGFSLTAEELVEKLSASLHRFMFMPGNL